jgi:hypothetical protein
MASPIEDFMRQSVSLQAPGTPDLLGAITYGTGASSVCRFWRETQRVRLPEGEILETKGVLLLPAATTVATGYKATIAGEPVLTVRHLVLVPDIDGATDHIRCYVD